MSVEVISEARTLRLRAETIEAVLRCLDAAAGDPNEAAPTRDLAARAAREIRAVDGVPPDRQDAAITALDPPPAEPVEGDTDEAAEPDEPPGHRCPTPRGTDHPLGSRWVCQCGWMWKWRRATSTWVRA